MCDFIILPIVIIIEQIAVAKSTDRMTLLSEKIKLFKYCIIYNLMAKISIEKSNYKYFILQGNIVSFHFNFSYHLSPSPTPRKGKRRVRM